MKLALQLQPPTPARPFVRWAGGKQRLVDELLAVLPDDARERRYVDPFVGGGALFWELRPRRALLSDACSPLVAAWQSVAFALEELEECLERQESARKAKGFATWYADTREALNKNMALGSMSPWQASCFLALIVSCFNGLWRVNEDGELNVSPDRGKLAADLVRRDLLRACHDALQDIDLAILHLDFRATLAVAGAGDLVFADPPYVPAEAEGEPDLFGARPRKESFTSYTSRGWSSQDTADLWHLLEQAVDRGAVVVHTNHDAPEVRAWALNAGFLIFPVGVHRSVSCDASTRGDVGEIIVVGGGR